MANRSLLPIVFKEEFIEWLKSKGYEIQIPEDYYEEIRATKGKDKVIVYKKMKAVIHLSVRDKDVKIVREFLRERKDNG